MAAARYPRYSELANQFWCNTFINLQFLLLSSLRSFTSSHVAASIYWLPDPHEPASLFYYYFGHYR